MSDAVVRIEIAGQAGATVLDLSDMRLTDVPSSLENLTNLTTLNLGSNQLSVLPEWLGNLTNLTHLDLNGKRWVSPHLRVVGASSLQSFLRTLSAGAESQ